MTPKEFFLKYNGKGVDFDFYYGFQCMDLYQQYNKECVGGPVIRGNAVDMWTRYSADFYDKIENSPNGVPQEGDVVIWDQGVGQFGHIAVFKAGDINSFTSFDQNWPLGSICHFQPHNYKNVVGWLHPKHQEPAPPTTDPDKVKINLGEPWGILEVQAIKSLLKDMSNNLKNSQQGTVEWIQKYNECMSSHSTPEQPSTGTTEPQPRGFFEWLLHIFR